MSVNECKQCTAQTKAGARCKARTCKYADYCWIHTKTLLRLGLRPSSIPRSGSGLFTYVDIPANKNICEYKGDNISSAEYTATDSGYGIIIPHGRVIDGKSTQSSLGRYANDCRPANKRAGVCSGNNARYSINTRNGVSTVNVKSIKRIPAGSEIFVSYGAGYWR